MTDTQVGYTGGRTENPTYKQVCAGGTGHAEAVEVTFDPAAVSYEELLDVFFRIHNPARGGGQYGSAVFAHDADQEKAAEAAIERLRKAGRRVATVVTEAETFWRAEEYHQRYYEKSRKR